MSLAHVTFDIPLRDRILFGRGRIAELPRLVRDVGGRHAFVVTDPVSGGKSDAYKVPSQALRGAMGLELRF